MSVLFDVSTNLVALIFLGIVGMIAGVAIPGLFMVVAAPWLDWLLPVAKVDKKN
jgi:hypothetical protein